MKFVLSWPAAKRGMIDQRAEEADVVRHAADVEFVECVAHAADRLVAVVAIGDQLGDHRIVVDRDFAPFVDARVDADESDAAGGRYRTSRPTDGQEIAERILGVDAGFDGPAAELDVVLRERQRLAGGDADHQLHQVETGDEFGDRMLDLQPRVHFEKVEIARRRRR